MPIFRRVYVLLDTTRAERTRLGIFDENKALYSLSSAFLAPKYSSSSDIEHHLSEAVVLNPFHSDVSLKRKKKRKEKKRFGDLAAHFQIMCDQ